MNMAEIYTIYTLINNGNERIHQIICSRTLTLSRIDRTEQVKKSFLRCKFSKTQCCRTNKKYFLLQKFILKS